VRKPRWILRTSLWSLGALLVGIGGLIILLDQTTSDKQLVQYIQRGVQSQFTADLEALRQQQPWPAAAHRRPGREEPVPGLITLRYDTTGRLTAWSDREFTPSRKSYQRIRQEQAPLMLREQKRIYLVLKRQRDTSLRCALVPLWKRYPIRNDYLPNYLYLGPYREWIDVEQVFATHQLTTDPEKPGIKLHTPEGRYLLTYQLYDTQPFRQPLRVLAVILLAAGVLLLLSMARRTLERHTPRAWLPDALLVLSLAVLRLLLLVFHLPGAYVQTPFFSSSVLALNTLNPSLGDLTLNTILLILLTYKSYKHLPQERISNYLLRWGAPAWWGFHGLAFILGAWCFRQFFLLFDRLVINSKIYYEFADFFRLDIYSYVIFFNVALVLASLVVLLYLLIGISNGLCSPSRRYYWQAGGLLAAGTLLWYVFLAAYSPIIPAFFAGMVVVLYILRAYNGPRLQFSLLQALVIFALMAGTTNLAVSQSLEHSTLNQLESAAGKYAEQKNLLTEYTFDGVVENIRSDTMLWQTDSTGLQKPAPYQYVVSRIINKHLMNSFKRYDFRVFLFRGGKRLDQQYDLRPYRLTPERRKQGKTLSDNLFLVPYQRSVTQNIYVGRLSVNSPLYGPMTIQIELHPKTYTSGKLYPQLLLDSNIRKRLSLPQGYSVAIYVNNQLTRKEGEADFPLTLPQRPKAQQAALPSEGAYLYRRQLQDDKLIIARAPKRSNFDRLTGFSFLFYFYILLYLLWRLPALLDNNTWSELRRKSNNFAFRLQLFMVGMTLLPLLAIYLFTTPLFQRFYLQDNRQELQGNLEQVASYLENEANFISDLDSTQNGPPPSAVDLMVRISDILSTDINIYGYDGRLFMTTRPKIYQMGLTSRQINPAAYRTLSQKQQKYLILNEHIGQLTYFSGYVPLFNDDNRLQGYLNIPFLSQQDLLRSQMRRFIAYLINVYVVLLMILVFSGVLILKGITRPLRILKQKMDQTQLGSHVEPIRWQSDDEIGAIIQSYNKMVEKLEASEKKLAKSERELAWREMARQVAHEIKNPLTPMKLTIQHLIRTLKNFGDPKSQALAHKVSNTLLTQINSLTTIANSFSHFATLSEDNKGATSLNDLLSDVYNLYQHSSEAELSLSLPEADIKVYADKNQLTRVFVNLVKNALQADSQQVMIAIEQAQGEAVVSVSDDGSGIPEDIQTHIFEPNFSTKTSGMGLGLAITRRIVENMNGRIRFVSSETQGTTFYLTFPLHEPVD
jgi:signal transduction histidine kinase